MEQYGNEQALQERRNKAQAYHFRMVGVVQKLAESRDGSEFLRKLLRDCGCFEARFCPDAAQADFFEGRKAIGFEVMKLVQEAGPQALVSVMSMEKEQ